MTMYQLGETIRLTATITDSDGVLSDPTTVTISIRMPDRTMAETAQAMSTSGTGVYYYDYTPTTETAGIPGTYQVRVTATGVGGRVTISRDEFDVEESI